MTEQERDLIDEVLDNFDFEKVKKVTDALNGTWSDSDIVPEIYDLRKLARRLLKDAIKENLPQIATGGFRAGYSDKILSLEFIVAEWDEELKEE